MVEIGTFDARNRFSELLAKAERGEEIVITRRGRPVAKLVPLKARHDVSQARAALKRIRTLAQDMKLGRFDWQEWKNHRDGDAADAPRGPSDLDNGARRKHRRAPSLFWKSCARVYERSRPN